MEAGPKRSWPCCRRRGAHAHRRRPQTGHVGWPKGNPRRRSRRGAVIPRLPATPKGNWASQQLRRSRGFVALNHAPARSRAMVGGFDFSEQLQPRPQAWRQRARASSPSSTRPRWKGLHASHGDQRRAALLRRRHHRQPALGPKNYDLTSSQPRCRCAARSPSRRTWCRSASCDPSAPQYAQDWVTRFGFGPSTQPT